MRRVLALSGRRFAGKDTLAALLVARARARGPALRDEVVADDGDLAALRGRALARLDAWLAAAGAPRGDG